MSKITKAERDMIFNLANKWQVWAAEYEYNCKPDNYKKWKEKEQDLVVYLDGLLNGEESNAE